MTYADVLVHIGKRDNNRFPVEITVEGELEFPRGYLDAATQPPLPTDAHYADAAYGKELFSWFLADEQLKENWAEIRGAYPERRVRLYIDADEPTLHQVVWEALCEPAKDQLPERHLAAHPSTPFSRYLAGKTPHGKPILSRPIRILVAAPAPEDFEQKYPSDQYPDMAFIDPEKEFDALQGALQPLIDGKQVKLTPLPPPCTLAAIAKELLLNGYHVLHLICHGEFSKATDEARLILADANNRVKPEADTDVSFALTQQLTAAGIQAEDKLRLIFLASCETAKRSSADAFRGLAPKLVHAGVPAVVAMQGQVGEETAREFAAVFYARLLDHGQVDLAANEARHIVMTARLEGPVIPVLFLRLKDGRLFAQPQKAPVRRRLQAPPPPDFFAGRTDEIRRLGDRLTVQPAATVTVAIQGVGGQGKSVLARQLGRLLEPHFSGVLWVDVGQSNDPTSQRADIVNAIALELELDLKDEPLLDKRAVIVRSALKEGGRLLAILDDVWEVDLARWLRGAVLPDDCAVLVTSRDLGLCKALASYVEPLRGLPVPDGLRLLANLLGELGQHENRARELVLLLDGHPLALELAARQCLRGPRDLARIKVQLEQTPSLDVLTLEGEERRETSLERCFLLSYQHLDPEQRRCFRSLGVFAQGPFDLPALAAVWGAAVDQESETDLADADRTAIWLVRRGLLVPAEDRLLAGMALEQPVYMQHTLLRRYALALLHEEKQEEAAAFGGHSAYFGKLASEGWRQAELFWPQVTQGWSWAQRAGPARALDYYYAVRSFLNLRGRHQAHAAMLEALLAMGSDAISDRERNRLRVSLGNVYDHLGESKLAEEHLEQALGYWHQIGDRVAEAATLNNLGSLWAHRGEQLQARDYYEHALSLIDEDQDEGARAGLITNLALAYDNLGDHQKALELHNKAWSLMCHVGDQAGEAVVLHNLGRVHSNLGAFDQALHFYEQALTLVRDLGDQEGEAQTLDNIGETYRQLGKPQRALQIYLEEVLPIRTRIGDPRAKGGTLGNIGVAYLELGDLDRALDFCHQARVAFQHAGDKTSEAQCVFNIGRINELQNVFPEAVEHYEQARILYRQVGRMASMALCSFSIGRVNVQQNRQHAALAALQEAQSLYRELGDKAGEAAALHNMAFLSYALNEKLQASNWYEQALSLRRQAGDKAGEALTCHDWALLCADLGDFEAAEKLLLRTIELKEDMGDSDLESDLAMLHQVRTKLHGQQPANISGGLP